MEEEEKKRPRDGLFVLNMGAIKLALKKRSPIIVIITIIMFLVGTVLSKGKIQLTWTTSGKIMYYKEEGQKEKNAPYLASTKLESKVIKKMFFLDNTKKMFYERMKEEFGEDKINAGIGGGVTIDKESGFEIFIVSFKHSDQDICFRGANIAMDVIKDAYFDLKNKAAEKVLEKSIIKERELKDSYINSQWQLDEFQKKLGVISFPNALSNIKLKLKDIDLQLFNLSVDIENYRSNIAIIDKKLSIPYKPGGKFDISSFKKELKEKELELTRLNLRYTNNHPKIKMLRQEIEILRDLQNDTTLSLADTVNPMVIVDSLYGRKTDLTLDLNSLIKKEKYYKVLQDEYESRQKYLESFEKEYNDLEILKENSFKSWKGMISDIRLYKDLIESRQENIQLYKAAEMPTVPEKKTRKILIVILSVVGLLVSTVVVIIREIFDMRIRYQFDLENRFGLEYLGTVPNIDDVKQTDFDNHLLELTTNFDNFMLKFEKPITLFVISDIVHSGKSFVLARLEQLLIANDYKILYIESTRNSGIDIDDKFINQFIFNHNIPINLKISSLHPNIDKCYFNLNDKLKFKIPNKKAISKFYKHLKGLKYDFIFIEGFPFDINKHIYVSLAEKSDASILILKHLESSRKDVTKIVDALDEKGIEDILGIRNDVDKKFANL